KRRSAPFQAATPASLLAFLRRMPVRIPAWQPGRLLYGGLNEARYLRRATLPPAPLHKNPAAPLANIVMRYPAGTRTWRLFPPSLLPTVSVAIPTMVPGHPHMVTAGG